MIFIPERGGVLFSAFYINGLTRRCQEFVDLNPQTMAPVAFWVLNEDEDFKGGDYVDFQETETTAVPLAVELCKKNPQSELSKIKDEIKKELSK